MKIQNMIKKITIAVLSAAMMLAPLIAYFSKAASAAASCFPVGVN